MRYNWQQKVWPQFNYDLSGLSSQLSLFSEKVGKIKGLLEGLTAGVQLETIVEAMVSEALNTSSIEDSFHAQKNKIL